MAKNIETLFPNQKTVYGPVPSRRFGSSLGIDPIFETSTCTFNCIYCQLGEIQKKTDERRIYVPTEQILRDFNEIVESKQSFDVLTFSGCGEPTLALNLEEVSLELKRKVPDCPFILLTNGTLLHLEEVRKSLKAFDRVTIKLDALNQQDLTRINRPVSGVTFEKIISGIKKLRTDYQGKIELQTMMFHLPTEKDLMSLVTLYKELAPDAIQLNTPSRPYPLSWHRENRGNHLGIFDYEVKKLSIITKEETKQLEESLRKLTEIKIISVY